MKLGRGHDSDFRVSDISFSRSHASIRLSKGKYYFEDFNSKFGSLVQVKRPLILDNSSDILIQTGRTLIEIKAKKPWSLFPSCLFSNVRQKDDINTLEQDNLPLFPFNTGISLSSNFSPKKSTPKSILYKNFGFGKNSSIESEEPDFLIVEPYILPDNPLETSEGDPDLD